MTEIPSIAVIGAGYWGKNLVRNFYQFGALKLVCDQNETLLDVLKSQHAGIETSVAIQEALVREDIQGVVIATPAETHYALTREFLLAGKHVFVEKPMALREAEGAELIEIAKQQGKTLMVGHLLQYHSVFIRLKELVKSGELGRVNYIYSNRLNLGKIRREENILWSFAPHDISMILALAGEEPESVVATGGNYLHHQIADVTTTHLQFASGMQAHIFVSWLHPFKEQKLVVVGDRKMAVFDDTLPWADKLLLYPHQIKWENQIPIPAKAEAERFNIKQDEPLRLECQQFLDCLLQGKRPLTDGEEGLRVLKVLNASQRSLDEQNNKVLLKSVEAKKPLQSIASKFFAHETALIDDKVMIGEGTKIWHFSHVLSGSNIGKKCNIGQNVVVGPDVAIGDNCKIQNNVSVYKGVTLEDGVFCGPSMVFTNIINPRAEIVKMDQLRHTLVKHGASIGANATIVCGVTLGRYCFVGAGAVVIRNVPNHALMVGNPARQIGWVCACGERLGEQLKCAVCGKQYKNGENGLEPENKVESVC